MNVSYRCLLYTSWRLSVRHRVQFEPRGTYIGSCALVFGDGPGGSIPAGSHAVREPRKRTRRAGGRCGFPGSTFLDIVKLIVVLFIDFCCCASWLVVHTHFPSFIHYTSPRTFALFQSCILSGILNKQVHKNAGCETIHAAHSLNNWIWNAMNVHCTSGIQHEVLVA